MKLFHSLTFLAAATFFSFSPGLAQETIVIPPLENTGKQPLVGTELSLGLAEVLGEVFRSQGRVFVPATSVLHYNVMQNLPYDLTNGYGIRLGEKDLEIRSRVSYPEAWFLGGSYRVEGGRLYLKIFFSNPRDPKAGGRFEKDAAYPNEVFALTRELADWAEEKWHGASRTALAIHENTIVQPRDYRAFEAYVEGIRMSWRYLPDYQEGAIPFFSYSTPSNTNQTNAVVKPKSKSKKNPEAVSNLGPEAPFYFSAVKGALLRARQARNRELGGFESAPSNVDAFWAGALAALKLTPRHPLLSQAAAYGAIRLKLGETAWSFLQTSDPWRTEDGRNADPEVDRLYSLYYENFPERNGGEENGHRLAFESLRRVSRLYPNDVRALVDLARINREEGARAAQTGNEKKAGVNFRAAKNFLDRALLVDRENAWIYDGFALFYLQKENRGFYNKEVAIGSALTAVEKSGGRVPSILFTLAQVLLANNERSRTFYTMDKVLALSKRADFVAFYEELKAGKR